jgi:hypothetical protein
MSETLNVHPWFYTQDCCLELRFQIQMWVSSAFLMSFIFGEVVLPRIAVAESRIIAIVPDFSWCYSLMHTQNFTILFLHAIQFAYSLILSVSHAQKWKYYIATCCTLNGLCIQSVCLKVLQPCVKVLLHIFKAGYYNSISQSVFTVRDFGEFTKGLKNFASTPFRIYVSRERRRESLF